MKNSIYWIAVGLCVLVIAWKLVTIIGHGVEYIFYVNFFV